MIKFINGNKWYPFLVEKPERPQHLTLFSQKIRSLRQIYVRLTGKNGDMHYSSFSSPISLYKYIMNFNEQERCFDEVISDSQQKVRFDIDIEKENEEDTRDLDDILKVVIDSLLSSLFKIIPDLKLERIFYFSSHGETKRSVHIVLPDYHTSNCIEAKELCLMSVKNMPSRYSQFIDSGIYSDNHSLRIMNCCKLNSNRVKRFNRSFYYMGEKIIFNNEDMKNEHGDYSENTIFINSLISIITDSKRVNITVNLNKNIKRKNISNPIVSQCLELAKNILGPEFTYEYEDTVGSIIVLKRIAPSFCRICNRVHESQHPFLLYQEANLYFNCRRCTGKRGLFLGNLCLDVSDILNDKEGEEKGENEFDKKEYIENDEKYISVNGSVFCFGHVDKSKYGRENKGEKKEKEEEREEIIVINKSKSKTPPRPVKKEGKRDNGNGSEKNEKEKREKKELTSCNEIDKMFSMRKKDFCREIKDNRTKKLSEIINIENIKW